MKPSLVQSYPSDMPLALRRRRGKEGTSLDSLPAITGIGVDSHNRLEIALSAFDKFPKRLRDCYALLGYAWSGATISTLNMKD